VPFDWFGTYHVLMSRFGWTRAQVDDLTLADLVLLTNEQPPPPAGVRRLTTAAEVIAEMERRQTHGEAWMSSPVL
jgi:hypothetical protein